MAPPKQNTAALPTDDQPTITPEDLRNCWKSGSEHKRRDFIRELLCIYDHDWKQQLEEELKRQFLPQNWEKLILRADTSINLLAWASDELGGIYNEPATRTIDGDHEGLEAYTSEGELDAALDEAARLCFATRQVILRPLVVERDDEMVVVIDVITPDCVCVIPNADDPLKIDAIAVQLSKTRWSIWTKDTHWLVGPDWKVDPGKGHFEVPNPYGVIPYIVAHARYPSRGHWQHRRSCGLLEATYQVGVGKTDHQHLRHTSSFKQMYVRSDKKDEQVPKMLADPTSVIQVRGQNAEVGVVDMQADLGGHLESLMQGAQATLALYGIRPEAVKGTVDASSGYALSLKMHKQQQAWGAYRRAWTRNERALFRVARSVWAVDAKGQPPLPEGKLEIEHAELGAGQDPKEQAERAEILDRIGWSKANISREVFGKDDEWIESNETELLEERANRGDLMEPAPPAPGDKPKPLPFGKPPAKKEDKPV